MVEEWKFELRIELFWIKLRLRLWDRAWHFTNRNDQALRANEKSQRRAQIRLGIALNRITMRHAAQLGQLDSGS